ncbi:MAG: beta galactosidase jelly roll domain-containing protein [Nitrospirae bacterium]|nr:beta galactosidase jelly roll domain-containing protein [Nitrospirota bacterium]
MAPVVTASAFILAATLLSAPPPTGEIALLDGTHLFRAGDDPAWSAPEADESGWIPVHIPGSLQSQGLHTDNGHGWYRLHFTLPRGFSPHRPALFLGRIGNSDETFLNGIRIGSAGAVRGKWVEATWDERLYPVPASLLRTEGENVLAIHVLNTWLSGGIMDGPAAIGDYAVLREIELDRENDRGAVESVLLSLFAFLLLAALWGYARGIRGREMLLFCATVMVYEAIYFLDTLLFYQTGWKGAVPQWASFALWCLLPALFLVFVISFCKARFHWAYKAIVALSIPLAAALVTWSGGHYTTMAFLFYAYAAAAGIAPVVVAAQAVRRRVPESGTVLLGVVGVVFGINAEVLSFLGIYPDHFLGPLDLGDLAAGFFVVLLTFALAARFIRIRNTMRSLSARVLNAYEDERKRLSRELHDGVGQSLLAVKLGLQMAEANLRKGERLEVETFTRAVADLSHSIDELRAVAVDLRPSALERTTMADAVRWHARLIRERSEVRISVEADPSFDIPLPAKDHFYRIFQEALGNAVKHSGAQSIRISLRKEGRAAILEIHDDGKGMKGGDGADRGLGLGLITIKERAELLNGSVALKTAPGGGTTLVLAIPTHD